MPRRETVVRLRHMLDNAREAVDMGQGKTRADLDTDRALNLALVRLLEIIGLRNRLIHGYDEVDLDIVWQIITADLPPLIKSLEKILEGKK